MVIDALFAHTSKSEVATKRFSAPVSLTCLGTVLADGRLIPRSLVEVP